ncbi:LuxR C-terminal-related transcriptional regulator [uncultured Desulfobacter sp.]|uniref:helix-turn-helix transcriptional regulator n=1 Tax=uncultured Desulfobacter sp. TaxID=240139 RepID=UPI002AAC4750|nr:LuxR C-terminal-related transcriptional regulator [uncultured Desulfobacter sp.]
MLRQNSGLVQSDTNLMLDIIHSALCCRTSLQFHQLLDQTKALVPFSYARCGFGDCSEYDIKKIAAFHMISGFPEEWEARYARKDYYLDDNVAHTAFVKPGLIYWPDYIKIPGLDDERNDKSSRIMDEASSMGLEDGWLYSLRGNLSTEAAIISLSGKKFKKKGRFQKILEYLAPHLGQAVKGIIQGRENGLRANLTPRETEILSWTAAGKTAWEISQILNISQRTVEFHMGNVLKKLDAVNACQAVAIGLTSGLISY